MGVSGAAFFLPFLRQEYRARLLGDAYLVKQPRRLLMSRKTKVAPATNAVIPSELMTLCRPFPYTDCKQKGDYWYVGWVPVMQRLRETMGLRFDWALKKQTVVQATRETSKGVQHGWAATAIATLTIRTADNVDLLAGAMLEESCRDGSDAHFDSNPDVAMKAAASGALVRAAMAFGMAWELYDENSGRHDELTFLHQTLPAMGEAAARNKLWSMMVDEGRQDGLDSNTPVSEVRDRFLRSYNLENESLESTTDIKKVIAHVIETRRGVMA